MSVDTSGPKPIPKPDTAKLKNIAIFLEGFKLGKGDILPLGTFDLGELWNAIDYIKRQK